MTLIVAEDPPLKQKGKLAFRGKFHRNLEDLSTTVMILLPHAATYPSLREWTGALRCHVALIALQNPESLLSLREASAGDGREVWTCRHTFPIKGRLKTKT